MESVAMDRQNPSLLEDFSRCIEHENWTRAQLQEYQRQALASCREYAYAHSPFYQRFHQGLMDRPLRELPVLTKAMMMEHFDELVTDRAIHLQDIRRHLAQSEPGKFFLDKYVVTATSGSTGQPGIFLYDRSEDIIEGNSFIRSQYWGGITPQSKSAVVTTGALPPMVIDGQPVPRISLSANDSPDTLVQRLNEWQPEVLVGHASITAVLAHEQRQGRLHISPRVIFCAGDTLTGDMRRRIEDVWQTRIFNVYGTSEGGALAGECAFHQGLHLFEDFSIIEVVDENNQPVPPGQTGDKVLLTVLYRHTQPLIRYEVSDLVRLSSNENCPCGCPFALVEAIEGRMIEVLSLPSSTGSQQRISPYLFTRVFNPLPISGWQVVQEQDGLHVFLTGAAEDLSDKHVLNELQRMFSGRGVIVPAIEIHRVKALRQTPAGKMPMVIASAS